MTHKSHRHILPLIAAALCLMLAACRPASPYRAALDAADSLMESRPDSALSLLRAIPSEQITDRATRARHAMLHAMARDKNYIDDTTFTILQPAIDYYENHGTPTEKLRTFYYQGRIYDNTQEQKQAIQALQKALEAGRNSNDNLTKARAHFSLATIEKSLMIYDEAAKDGKKAAHYFQQAGRTNSYARSMMITANSYSVIGKHDSAYKYMYLCQTLLDSLSTAVQKEFYEYLFVTEIDSFGTDNIARFIQAYQAIIPPQQYEYDHLSLAYAYLLLGEYDKVLEVLSHYPIHSDKKDDMRYYALLATVYAKQERYKEAYQSYCRFYAMEDSFERAENARSTRFTKPRYQLEQKIEDTEQSRALVILTAAACILALSGWLIILHHRVKTWRRRKKEAEAEIENQRQQAEAEIENQRRQKAAAEQEAREYAARHSRMSEEMQTLRQNLKESQALNRTAKVLMAQRLALLNELIADKSGKHSPVQNALTDMLSKPETFMQSTRQTLSITHPRFIRTLQQHDLTDEEIGLCCLYALGLNTKQAGIYVKNARTYHANSAIRQKLKLDTHVTNLNLYIARMLQQEEEKTTAKGGEI